MEVTLITHNLSVGFRWVDYDLNRMRCDHSRYSCALDLGVGHAYCNEVSGIELDTQRAKAPLPANGKELVLQAFTYHERDVMSRSAFGVVVKKCQQTEMSFVDSRLGAELNKIFTTIENVELANGPSASYQCVGGREDFSIFKAVTVNRPFFCPQDAVCYHKGGISAKYLAKQLAKTQPPQWLALLLDHAKTHADQNGASVLIIYAIVSGHSLRRLGDNEVRHFSTYPIKGKPVIIVHPGGQVELFKAPGADPSPQR